MPILIIAFIGLILALWTEESYPGLVGMILALILVGVYFFAF